jgi:hypothetical protein
MLELMGLFFIALLIAGVMFLAIYGALALTDEVQNRDKGKRK